MSRTGFFHDERCFWHAGGNYAFTLPLGGFVQPLAAGGLPENPETKRRLKNLMEVSGLLAELDEASWARWPPARPYPLCSLWVQPHLSYLAGRVARRCLRRWK